MDEFHLDNKGPVLALLQSSTSPSCSGCSFFGSARAPRGQGRVRTRKGPGKESPRLPGRIRLIRYRRHRSLDHHSHPARRSHGSARGRPDDRKRHLFQRMALTPIRKRCPAPFPNGGRSPVSGGVAVRDRREIISRKTTSPPSPAPAHKLDLSTRTPEPEIIFRRPLAARRVT